MQVPKTDSPKLAGELAEFERYCARRDLRKAADKLWQLESEFREEVSTSPEFLLHKATFLNQTGDYRDALRIAAEAYELVRQTSDHALLARIQTELARAHQYLGETDRSDREYRDVAASFRRMGDVEGVIDTLNRIAGIRYLRADYDEARRLLDEAWHYADELGDELRLARISGNIGRIALRQGRFNYAVDKLSISIEKHGKLGNDVSLSKAFLSLALVEIRLANYDSARRNLRNALSIIREHDLKRELAIYFEYRAELQAATGSLDEALASIQSAIEQGRDIASDGDLISQSERIKAGILYRMRRYDEAEDAASKALHVAERIDEKLEIAESTKLLALISDRKGASTDSRQQIEYAIALLQQLKATYELADCYEQAAQLTWLDNSTRVFYRVMATDLLGSIGLEADLIREPKPTVPDRPNRHVYAVTGASGDSVQIITANKQMRSILRIVDHCKDSDIPILITGETGTGKDLLAKFIHNSSNRSGGRFVAVNCSAIPKELAESELFGHVKGAFTNALENKEGLITASDGGTLFLNEIGDLPIALQAKLLGCLEEKKVVRVGDTVAQPVNFRLITATNRDLEENIETGQFRRDLYFRIAVMTLDLPPLRQRQEDLVALMKFFMAENGMDIRGQKGLFNENRIRNIISYGWPGNVRELRNEVQLMALECEGDHAAVIETLDAKLGDPSQETQLHYPSGLAGQVATFERERIQQALRSTSGVIRKAAKLLQIPEATLRSKIKRLKI